MSLVKHARTLLVIVAEAALEKLLIEAFRRHGAAFWTIGEVHSAGRDGVRDGDWEADRTIEIKVLCEPPVADAIAAQVMESYAAHYSVALYFSEVGVLRPQRY